MPHYADGTEAKVGDQVYGVLYNSGPEPKAGTIISITHGTEVCNVQVQFVEAYLVERPTTPKEGVKNLEENPPPRMSYTNRAQLVWGQNHGSIGERWALYTCVDYCQANQLTKVG